MIKAILIWRLQRWHGFDDLLDVGWYRKTDKGKKESQFHDKL